MTSPLTSWEPTFVEDELPGDAQPTPPTWLLAGLLALLLGGLFGGLAGYRLAGGGQPAADSIDVGFARDMSIHHEQAVQMAALVYDRTEDDAIRQLAYDILTTQQGQIGIMSGWLDAWGHAWTTAGPRMTWMGMAVEGLMPGMATPEQMAALRAATGETADAIFLELMIPHHQSGVEMAQVAADQAAQEPVRALAAGMVEAQALEIDYMRALLAAKDPLSVPDAPADSHDH